MSLSQPKEDSAKALGKLRPHQKKEFTEILYNDPMLLIGAQEGVVMAHRDWLKGFVQNPLWPRPSLKFSLFDK